MATLVIVATFYTIVFLALLLISVLMRRALRGDRAMLQALGELPVAATPRAEIAPLPIPPRPGPDVDSERKAAA